MYQIRPWLYNGKRSDMLDLDNIPRHNINAMLQLAERIKYPPDIAHLHLPIKDGVPLPKETLRTGVDFVLAEKARGHNAVIVCGTGASRSVGFSVAALKEAESLSLLEALRSVRERHHPMAMPRPELWESLCSYYGEQVPFWEAFHETFGG